MRLAESFRPSFLRCGGRSAPRELAGLTDSDGATTSSTFDAVDRRTRVGFPEGRSACFAYDALGRLVALSEPGQAPGYGYGTRPWGTSPYGGQAGGAQTEAAYFAA